VQVPVRGMNGVKSRILSLSRGLAVMSSTFAEYRPFSGAVESRDRGNPAWSKWPPWRGHSWPPRARRTAAEGLGLAF